MARRRRKYYYTSTKRKRRREDPRFEPIGLDLAPETKRGIAIVLFFLLAIVSALSLMARAGRFGETVASVLRMLFGSAAYVAPAIFFGICLSLFLGVRLFHKQEGEEETGATSQVRTYLGATLFILAVTGLLHVFALHGGASSPVELVKTADGPNVAGGGYLGLLSSIVLYPSMGFVASLIILLALVATSILVAFDLSLHGFFRVIIGFFRGWGGEEDSTPQSGKIKINTMENSGFSKASVKTDKTLAEEAKDEDIKPVINTHRPALDRAKESAEPAHSTLNATQFTKKDWKLPPFDLLEETTAHVQSGNIEACVKIIKKTLEDFGVIVDMGEVNVGPTVTQYTFRPAVGVKLSQIVSLQNDLALALAAPSIRIEAPIPGRALVGIEVPNPTSTIVSLRGLLESEIMQKNPSSLAFALGRDVAGHPMIADLERMPHLLVAGSTGSGKTVCLNTILTSFLYRNSPQELRLVVIDPKRVDLTLYSGIPHLLTPVVTDHKQAVNALKWAVAEMDRRYTMLSETGKRNIQEFNQSTTTPIPYIVIVVDELAQLMSLAKNDVESCIVRLAQMARAVGIHLILATQRPSVDVITGLIKANIATRIAFMVASQIDSRTIIDMAGAENLLGRGDMLYSTSDLPLPKRVQSPFISTKELRRVLDFLIAQSGPVDYQEEILTKPAKVTGMNGGDDDEADDDMINAAIEEIKRSHKASASLLQRRLSVGYARAARILDILEDRGLIGPANGAKPREIYMEQEEYID